eukprot:TRINITY_DN10671_c0_g1_i1.p1 TRINITY_DN10671_c0_g1~~TRINITY_DN10671_c0_g1_i1.p1  ORF type:complete len:353 (+),score=61.34 TRINITY_DN10671_c0_g1_i1:67-1059(+)
MTTFLRVLFSLKPLSRFLKTNIKKSKPTTLRKVVTTSIFSSLATFTRVKMGNYNPEIYKFQTAVFSKPHPSKKEKGGEDSWFISKDHYTIGVFDGVGGWAEVGVDSKQYSEALSVGADRATTRDDLRDPLDILSYAYNFAYGIKGSSTACLAAIRGEEVITVNLGDSGCMVIRFNDADHKPEIIHRTQEQQHGFNFPYQLGSQSRDKPEDAVVSKVRVEDGDVVVLGSDGLWDNLFNNDIANMIQEKLQNTSRETNPITPQELADLIGERASEIANNTKKTSPFSVAARKAGYHYFGGKLDDITIIVALVTRTNQQQQQQQQQPQPSSKL